MLYEFYENADFFNDCSFGFWLLLSRIPGNTFSVSSFILIYFVWKAYRFQDENESMKRQLQKILEILEKQESKTENGEAAEEKASTFSVEETGKAE